VISVDNLTLDYNSEGRAVRAVSGVSFEVSPSEVFGLVGESGSGKSTVAMALLGHIAPSARLVTGRVLVDGTDILSLPSRGLASLRGGRIGLVPQNPGMAFAPHLRLGRQFAELLLCHGAAPDQRSAARIAEVELEKVGLSQPASILQRYPHELSGGQQQRVCIAMAVALRPRYLVLDEPTTGLDATTQARIVDLLKALRSEFKIGMLYVTHDLALLSQIADRVGVMYAGRLVELAPVSQVFTQPRHPYSRGLLASMTSVDDARPLGTPLRGVLDRGKLPAGCPFAPRCDWADRECGMNEQVLESAGAGHQVACWKWRQVGEASRPTVARSAPTRKAEAGTVEPLIELTDVTLGYRRHAWWRLLLPLREQPVVRNIDLSINAGEIFALVGESGSGKSTIARAIAGLIPQFSGQLRFSGNSMIPRQERRQISEKRQIQYVFQNPDASLNPRETVEDAIGRSVRLYFNKRGTELNARVSEAIAGVRLDPAYGRRYPGQLSGGERQRVAIARALVAEPRLILCDEVLSALDVSVQASIIDLLSALRRDTGVAMLFISHDLSVVRALADRTGVLFTGTLVEVGSTESLFEPPFHPYTEELLLAAPSLLARSRSLPRSVERPARQTGCAYASRCRFHAGAICDEKPPPWRIASQGHSVRCHIDLSELAEKIPLASTRPASPRQ
jgi:peptide/nickel transport system ATP-binding protein